MTVEKEAVAAEAEVDSGRGDTGTESGAGGVEVLGEMTGEEVQ